MDDTSTSNCKRTDSANACLHACNSGPKHQKYFHLYNVSFTRPSSSVIFIAASVVASFQHFIKSVGLSRSTPYCCSSMATLSSAALLCPFCLRTTLHTRAYSVAMLSKKVCNPCRDPKLGATADQAYIHAHMYHSYVHVWMYRNMCMQVCVYVTFLRHLQILFTASVIPGSFSWNIYFSIDFTACFAVD